MKTKLILLVCLCSSMVLVAQTNRDGLPELNKQILKFVDQHIGKKVERGECWDLVQVPLDEFGADWDGQYVFGKKIDPKKDTILAGDIIQFEKVVVKYEDGAKKYMIEYPHHTAIVYEVLGNGVYKIAEQNTGGSKGRRVSIGNLNLNYVKKGKLTFFRPVLK